MSTFQPGILPGPPACARWLMFDIRADADLDAALAALGEIPHDESLVTGIGAPVASARGVSVAGLRDFPSLSNADIDIPSTQAALGLWLRGDDRGELLHRGRALTRLLAAGFNLRERLDTFMYADSRDLTGYVDGTENPSGEDALRAAFSETAPAGSSYVAVQRWLHDLDRFNSFGTAGGDAIIGRRRSDNEEIDDAPESAHVKHAAQESFEPEAFVLRRSMPWADNDGEGLQFVAFGASFDAFEAQLRRMIGLDDGTTDALFRFTKPVTGSYFWCPPCNETGTLDLSALRR